MSAGGSEGTVDRPADPAAEEKGQASQAGPSLPAVELPRKRKGVVEKSDTDVQQSLDFQMEDDLSRSEGDDQQVKMKCFREPHRQIEKRRRDKMNNLIDELSAMIPACQPMARKLDKLTVLRKAVQHLKALKAGTSSAFTDTAYKPSVLPHDDLRHLLLRVAAHAADSFLLVVSCDRAKILFISESVSKILNFSRVELTGQSLFDFIHPKDINKVKEQLSSSEMYPRQRLIDAATGAQVQADSPARVSHLSTGSRRSFFCRMKHSRVTGKQEEKRSLPNISKKKDTYRYCTLHCTGYMRSWPSSQLDPEGDAEKEPNLTCLVMVCRLHPHVPHHPSKDINVKPTEFITRCAIDGKFTFVDQQATTVIGYLPQEVLGTSCYEYFHQDDLQHLAEKHRQVLRSKEKIETQCYKFKTKYGSYVSLQSQWFNFTNPWTKEVEFIVSSNRVISGPGHTKDEEEAGSSKALQEDTKHIPVIPGLSSGLGPMIYAGSIGTQIANELIDSYRMNSSPSSGASSPFGPVQEKCPLVSPNTSRSASSREDAAGSSSQSQSDSRTAAGASSAASESTGEPSQLDLDSMVVPGLSSFSSDEAAMAVIMSLLETDVNMGQSGDFEDLHWPF
ncbi:aryl hydrocarbon receptor nuclear translocator-like protein 2 isoform X2 [Seriola lalandi dorsalis]|uniref:aryl hydrocarbon receptor nuclear translocator-like protein 2 isoform X2 n=1 Tax=Seriola lalandi dorsalis TaxID=1841481 RepID=UPI000C6FC7DD|nr:aryl hydrocarbon receptor nuclear translocator-like protein 2 isoform X2 [Seriola lalandi dorsalis]